MPENGNGERRAISAAFAVKWIHIVVFLGANLCAVAGLWATMRAQVDQLREEQKQTITEGEFREFKDGIERRLDDMKKTLDDLDRVALKKAIDDLH